MCMVVIKVETGQILVIAEQVERTDGGTREAFFPEYSAICHWTGGNSHCVVTLDLKIKF